MQPLLGLVFFFLLASLPSCTLAPPAPRIQYANEGDPSSSFAAANLHRTVVTRNSATGVDGAKAAAAADNLMRPARPGRPGQPEPESAAPPATVTADATNMPHDWHAPAEHVPDGAALPSNQEGLDAGDPDGVKFRYIREGPDAAGLVRPDQILLSTGHQEDMPKQKLHKGQRHDEKKQKQQQLKQQQLEQQEHKQQQEQHEQEQQQEQYEQQFKQGKHIDQQLKQQQQQQPKQDGLHDQRGHASIRTLMVVGERHSGTNLLRKLINDNLDVKGYGQASSYLFSTVKCEDPWPPKHGYQAPTLAEQALPASAEVAMAAPSSQPQQGELHPYFSYLVVVVIRNPWDWALAMHRDCWCKDKIRLTAQPLEEFLTSPWRDNCPKPWLGETQRGNCSNIMECRAAKIRNFMNMSTWVPFVEFVRYEDVATPALSLAWLRSMMDKYRLPALLPELRAVGQYTSAPHIMALNLSFDADAACRQSVWFNREQLRYNTSLRSLVHLVNRLMDKDAEEKAGYTHIELSPEEPG